MRRDRTGKHKAGKQNRRRNIQPQSDLRRAAKQDLERSGAVVRNPGSGWGTVLADRQSDLLAALALGREYGLKVVLLGAAEGWLVAKEIAAARVPVIAEATNDLPANFDALASRLDNTALLSAAGVKVLIAPFGRPHMVRNIVQEAGNAVSWGLPYDEAIRAISSNVADAFGLEGFGKLTDGARADAVLWTGDPLELSSRPVAMWIGGRQVPLTSRQSALLEKYRKLPAQ